MKNLKAKTKFKYLGLAEFSVRQFFSTGIRYLRGVSRNFHKKLRLYFVPDFPVTTVSN
jgi:hypothetical protein